MTIQGMDGPLARYDKWEGLISFEELLNGKMLIFVSVLFLAK